MTVAVLNYSSHIHGPTWQVIDPMDLLVLRNNRRNGFHFPRVIDAVFSFTPHYQFSPEKIINIFVEMPKTKIF